MRTLLLYLSRSEWMQRTTMRFGFFRRAAARFVAGNTCEDTLPAVRALSEEGYPITLNQLGEAVSAEAEAVKATEDYLDTVEQMAAAGLRAGGIAVKLTQLGLDLGQDFCASNLQRILAKAKAHGIFLGVDMEESAYVDSTLAIYRQFYPEYESLRVCLQAYLHRSQDDLRQLIEEGGQIRPVKGAYKEPAEIAMPRKSDVDANLIAMVRMVLEGTAGATREPRPYLSLASQDPAIIEATKSYAAELGLPKDAYEFQMLHGIRRDLQQQLLAEGYTMRIYVPFGTEWYPYFMRRLAERPANVWFLVSNMLRG